MVIVEELIARLGFEVGSLEDIRRASAELDELGKLTGRRLVTGADLIAPFGLGIGALYAVAWQPAAEPGRRQLPAGEVRLLADG